MKVCFITLGCKVNQYESESIAKKLKQNGIDVSFKLEEPPLSRLALASFSSTKAKSPLTVFR